LTRKKPGNEILKGAPGPADPTMLEEFMALSRVLTGVEDLDRGLGKQYLERLAGSPEQPLIQQILERFRKLKAYESVAELVKKEIVGDAKLRPTVCQMILLWFTSATFESETSPIKLHYGSQEGYFSGIVWTLMGAHVPGLSGGYFGHWRYAPENEPKRPK
jgi:Membrane bound FAD containing D-sorbitol dehydrogenase